MVIKENMVVSVNYKLSNHQTGEKIEETTIDNPMVFLYGVGSMIPQFEDNLFEKNVGDTFDFSINAVHAYGMRDENQITMIPLDVFYDETGKFDESYFRVGAMIPMSDSDGNHLRGKILEVTPELIKMDFNHPLAGIDLQFSGSIQAIRPATQDEINHGHVHGPGGHHH